VKDGVVIVCVSVTVKCVYPSIECFNIGPCDAHS
jgi:hypothetical protein